MIHLYAAPIPETYDNISSLLPMVSEERRAKIERLAFPADKMRCLLAEILLRYGLRKEYGFRNENIRFGYGEYGKPYLMEREDICFNLSHSGVWVLCGIGNLPLGVDVELIKEEHADIAERCFSRREYAYLCQQPEDTRKEVFYRLWTLKESYVKAMEKGLHLSFRTFTIEIASEEIKLLPNPKIQTSCRFFSDKLDQNHWAALCLRDDGKHPPLISNLQKITMEELLLSFHRNPEG